MNLKKPPVPVALMAGLTAALAAGSLALGPGVSAGAVDENTTTVGAPEPTGETQPVPDALGTDEQTGTDQAEGGLAYRHPVDDRSAPSAVRSLDVGCRRRDKPVTVTAPAADLAKLVAAAEPGTCFLLEPGEYRFSDVEPKDNMTFLGASRNEVVVQGDDSTENAFHGTATGVTIGRMRLVGFQGDGGTKPQEQAPIRGTSALWASDRGEMAVDWLIEDIESSGNIAAGVFLGDAFTIRGSLLADNGVTGLGGSAIVDGLIEKNVIRGNGQNAATGAYSNGAGIKFTEAIAGNAPVTVQFNEIYENRKIGIWCDLACDGFHVISNYIHDQESRAVMYELSSNAVIRHNVAIDANTWTNFRGDFNAAAITVGESSDVLVESNYIEGARAGIIARQTKRPISEAEDFLLDYENITFITADVEVRNNLLVDVGAMGLSFGPSGFEVNPDLAATVTFEGNTYTDSDEMEFWLSTDPIGSEAWQASGNDTTSRPVPMERPALIPMGS